ncbi:MAG: hypothetical protein K0S41_2327 [Anaerocolumna sp.]|jgi:hypothetical protein|nr:hypothetical protein [Anaerocolumna sp.]
MYLDMMEQYEKDIIDKIISNDIEYDYAAVSVVLYLRDFVRPEIEIPSLLMRIIPSLNEQSITRAIYWMKSNYLIKSEKRNGYNMLRVVDDFPSELEKLSSIKDLSIELIKIKESQELKAFVRCLGKVGSENNYDTFLTALSSAQKNIKYPILNTSPYPALIDTLKKIAKNGVEIFLLMGSNDILSKIKGNIQKSYLKEWKKEFKGIKNVKIRIFSDIDTVDLCTSVLIDDKVLRMVVYDPLTITSLEGTLLEIRNKMAQNINLIKWFNEKFSMAWDKGRTNNFTMIIRKIVSLFNIMLILSILSVYFLIKYYEFNQLLTEIVLIVLGSSGTYVIKHTYYYFKTRTKKLKKNKNEN